MGGSCLVAVAYPVHPREGKALTDKELSVSVETSRWHPGWLELHFTRQQDQKMTTTNTEFLSMAELRLTHATIGVFLKGVDGDLRDEG